MTDTPYLTEYLNRKKVFDQIKVGSKWISEYPYGGRLDLVVLEVGDSIKVLSDNVATLHLSREYFRNEIESGIFKLLS